MSLADQIASFAQHVQPPLIRQMNSLAHPAAINMGLGQLLFPVDQKIHDILSHPTPEDYKYPANAGLPDLRKAVASLYDGQAQNVTVTIGVQEAVFDTCLALRRCGAQQVLVPQPGFGIYKKIANDLGMQVRHFPLTKGFRLDLDVLSASVGQADIVVLNFPGNPTGVGISDAEQAAAAQALQKHNPIVISDEIYRQLTFDGPIPSSFCRFYPNTVVVDGISKTGACAGLRVGWAYTPDKNIATLISGAATTVKSCAPAITQRAALPVVNGDTADTLTGYRKALSKNSSIVHDYLSRIGIDVPNSTGGFYAFPRLEMDDTEAFCKTMAAAENGVVVIPGKAFGSPSHVRISFANNDVEEGMRRFNVHYQRHLHG